MFSATSENSSTAQKTLTANILQILRIPTNQINRQVKANFSE